MGGRGGRKNLNINEWVRHDWGEDGGQSIPK